MNEVNNIKPNLPEDDFVNSLLESSALTPSASHLKDGILDAIGLSDSAVSAYVRKQRMIKYSSGLLILIALISSLLIFKNPFNQVEYIANDYSVENRNILLTEEPLSIDVSSFEIEELISKELNSIANENAISRNSISAVPLDDNNSKIELNELKTVLAEDNEPDKKKNFIEKILDFSIDNSEIDLDNSYSTDDFSDRLLINQGSPRKFEFLPKIYSYELANVLGNVDLQFNWYGLNQSYPNLNEQFSSSIAKDLSFSVMYNFNNHHAVGITAGNDKFFLEYEQWVGREKLLQPQELELLWFGLNYKYEYRPLYKNTYFDAIPYAQIGTAYTKIGSYSNLNAGLLLRFNEKASLMLGASHGLLLYESSGWWVSHKTGANIGFALGL